MNDQHPQPQQPPALDRAEGLLASLAQELTGATHDQVPDTVLSLSRAVDGYRVQTRRTCQAIDQLGALVAELRAAAQSRPPASDPVEPPDADASAG